MKKVVLTLALALGLFTVQAQDESKPVSGETKTEKATNPKLDKEGKKSAATPSTGTGTSTGSNSGTSTDAETTEEPASQPATTPAPADKKDKKEPEQE